MPSTSSIHQLHPFFDKDGVLRVGGRLVKSNLSHELKHPVLVSKYCTISQLIIRYYHEKTEHSGRGMNINEIRNSGYWIIYCNNAVKSLIAKCVICRHLRRSICQQKMTDLPRERLSQEPPFTYCGFDMFGPILVIEGCKEMKRYGCLITCLSSRAIHIQSTNSLYTVAFIQARRRFASRQGNNRVIRTDTSRKFVGASAKLNKVFSEMNHKEINEFKLEHGGQWFQWKRNPPTASNMGEVWERQIRSARSMLVALLKIHGTSLNDELRRRFPAEVEAVVNTGPIKSEPLLDVHSPVPLCQMQLLTMKSMVVMPILGDFQKQDIYCMKQ